MVPGTARSARWPWVVELVRHAKSADAAYGRPALFNREEATICASATISCRIVGAPWIGIVRQGARRRVRQCHWQYNGKRRKNPDRVTHLQVSLFVLPSDPRGPPHGHPNN